MMGGQVLIMFVGGAAFSITTPTSENAGRMWGIALVLGFLSLPIGVLIRLIPDSAIMALIPASLKRRASKRPGVKVSDEEMGLYPQPLAEVRDELRFMRRMKGGRLKNLKFAVQHPREAIMHHSRSPSRSRSNSASVQTPQTTHKDPRLESGAGTPESRRGSKSMRSRSNSALGAPTVMAGLVAAGVAAGWSPQGRLGSSNEEEDNHGATSRPGSEQNRDD